MHSVYMAKVSQKLVQGIVTIHKGKLRIAYKHLKNMSGKQYLLPRLVKTHIPVWWIVWKRPKDVYIVHTLL